MNSSYTDKKIFLARNGKVAGPFSEGDIKRFEVSGRIQEYTWMFREGETTWTLMEIPPPLPDFSTAGQIQSTTPGRAFELSQILVHDFNRFLVGSIASLNESQVTVQCKLKSNDPSGVPFSPRSKVFINLIEPKSQKQINLQTVLQDTKVSSNGLDLCLSWGKIPSLLSA